MKFRILLIFALTLLYTASATPVQAESTRKERRLIMKGNDLYKESKFVEAQNAYEEALKVNANSAEARYNLGLSQIRQLKNPQDTTPAAKKLVENARENFQSVANLAKTKPGLAAKANYNLGNIEFNAKEFQKAIDYYKQALRIDPNDDRARKNLRIAQKNLQKQNQDQQNQNQQQNQDQQQQEDQQKDNQQNQNQDQQDKKEEQKQNNLSQQAASQILQAVDNKENQTRARVNRASKGDKSVQNGRNIRKW